MCAARGGGEAVVLTVEVGEATRVGGVAVLDGGGVTALAAGAGVTLAGGGAMALVGGGVATLGAGGGTAAAPAFGAVLARAVSVFSRAWLTSRTCLTASCCCVSCGAVTFVSLRLLLVICVTGCTTFKLTLLL